MKVFFIPALLCALALCACADDSDYFGDARQASETPAMRVAAVTPDNNFCAAVASRDAESGGFDPATKSRVYAASLRQCVMVFVVNPDAARVANRATPPAMDAR